MVSLFGCTSKSGQSSGDTQASQPRAKSVASQELLDTSFSGRDASGGGLRGLDKNPSEERLGGRGSLMTRADLRGTGHQMEGICAEQATAAGRRDVFFVYDSFAITEDVRIALVHNAKWIKANPRVQLKIEGHCDDRGTSAGNLVLGEKRVKAARNYLVELGAAPNHLSIVSYGKERSACEEHTESCYAQNRRGHMLLKTGK